MKSLRELLLLGPGPSSSHTIAPKRICLDFLSLIKEKDVERIKVVLHGSLSLTGKGHMTDEIIRNTLSPYESEVEFSDSFKDISHPNTMDMIALLKDGSLVKKRYQSIGGGSYIDEEIGYIEKEVYPFSSFDSLRKYMSDNNIDDIYKVIEKCEGEDIISFGREMLEASFQTIRRGLVDESNLPGPLHLRSVAKKLNDLAYSEKGAGDMRMLLLASYSYASAEENARGHEIVTAPTCGSCGVVPSVLYYCHEIEKTDMDSLARSYLVGALICNFIKENAACSGAMYGCQAEIGSASSFASSALSYLNHLSTDQIEYAAEVAMEHFLGLTCDPVDGYVQIPCIERNAMASIHSYASYIFSKDIAILRKNRVSFDNVIRAMKETGSEIPSDLKETGLGGLAKVLKSC